MPYYRYFELSGENTRVVKEGVGVAKVGDNLVLYPEDALEKEHAEDAVTFKPHCPGVYEHETCPHDWAGDEAYLVLLEVPTVEVKTEAD